MNTIDPATLANLPKSVRAQYRIIRALYPTLCALYCLAYARAVVCLSLAAIGNPTAVSNVPAIYADIFAYAHQVASAHVTRMYLRSASQCYLC